MSITKERRETQHDKILDMLAPGKFVCVTSFMKAHIPDYRKRLSELNAKEPGRFENRTRTHRDRAGNVTSRMKDWRDTSRDSDIKGQIGEQYDHAVKIILDNDPAPSAAFVFCVDALSVRSLTYAEIKELDKTEVVRRVFEAYIDPWGV